VKILEEGRQRYQVGIERQLCLLLDRGGMVYKNGEKKKEKLDMSVIPALVELIRHMYQTINDHYPDLLARAQIAPASRFFSMCYKITSMVMAKQHRDKFIMISEKDLRSKLHSILDKRSLPSHLLGDFDSLQSMPTTINAETAAAIVPPLLVNNNNNNNNKILTGYHSDVHIYFNPLLSYYPIDSKKQQGFVQQFKEKFIKRKLNDC
jgi:hypothetical protein